jgi:hypothetical protein
MAPDERLAGPPADALAAAAAAARRTYVGRRRAAELEQHGIESDWGSRYMPAWDGGDTERGYRASAWDAVAALCLKNGWDVEAYVAAQFHAAGDPPRPNTLAGDAAVLRYRTHERAAPKRQQQLRRNEHARFLHAVDERVRGGLTTAQALRAALRDQLEVDVRPLYRVAAALACGDREVAEAFLTAAVDQYARDRVAYDAAWGDAIPESVRAAADDRARALRALADRPARGGRRS